MLGNKIHAKSIVNQWNLVLLVHYRFYMNYVGLTCVMGEFNLLFATAGGAACNNASMFQYLCARGMRWSLSSSSLSLFFYRLWYFFLDTRRGLWAQDFSRGHSFLPCNILCESKDVGTNTWSMTSLCLTSEEMFDSRFLVFVLHFREMYSSDARLWTSDCGTWLAKSYLF